MPLRQMLPFIIVPGPQGAGIRSKRNDRPELARALKRCRVTGATLVVAKIDRLSRNAAFLMTLRDTGVDFVAADLPEANTMTVVVMVVAQHEREAISQQSLYWLLESYLKKRSRHQKKALRDALSSSIQV